MTKTYLLPTAVLLGLCLIAGLPAFALENSPRVHESFDLGWRFFQGDLTNAEAAAFADDGWQTVNVPHDWSIAGPYAKTNSVDPRGGYLPTGIGWYRKHFRAPESMRGKMISVEFDGVYRDSDVWLNGHFLGHYPFGYLGFTYDLTPYLNFGDQPNVIAVRVDNSKQPNSRWYSGSGIERHVWITATDPVHVAHWGTYVTTPEVSTNAATVRVRTMVQNEEPEARTVTLFSQIIGDKGETLATVESAEKLMPGGQHEFDQTLQLASPRLWSLEDPQLYKVRHLVKVGDRTVDTYDTPVGIREIRYDVNEGFFLNGQHVKMQGLCLHQDGGCVGAAIPIGVWERRLKLLKEMGCNAIRTSHNPPSPEFLDLCDEMGFLVMDEAFDEWKAGKVAQGYHKVFDQWAIKDLTGMLQRDRNHPGVVMWSVGNEISEQAAKNGAEVLRPLVETCHAEDATRPVTAACDRIFDDNGGAKLDFLNLLDIVGYNYADRWRTRRETVYSDDHQDFPRRKMVGTESVSIGGVRGEYLFAPLGPAKLTRAVYATDMIRAERLWRFVRVYDYVIGDFLWTGIDYLGESHWPDKAATFGALDTCGFPKDSYYFYQSVWATKPMLHLLPHWNWKGREGEILPVLAYTSCDTVELFLNGKSYGVKAREFPREGTAGGWNKYAQPQVFPTTADLHLAWDVPYEPGVLKAVGYKGGEQVCVEEIHTAGAPAAIELSTDHDTLRAGERDVANLTVKIVDAEGNIVPGADNLVKFDVQGAGTLIGVDNGDPADHAPYQAAERKAFDGLALAVVQSGFEPGELHITVTADPLKSATFKWRVEKSPKPAQTFPPVNPQTNDLKEGRYR
jgi:beta-galactosidase